ncbi:MAG: Fe(3+) dicitrate transport protein, partial [Rhodothermales bacterium]
SAEDQMAADQHLLMARHRIRPFESLDIVSTVYATAFKRNWYKLDAVVTDSESVKIGALLDSPLGHSAAYGVMTGQTSNGYLAVKANNREYSSRGFQTDVSFARRAFTIDAGVRLHRDDMDRFQWVDQYGIESETMALANPGVKGSDSNRIESSEALAGYVQVVMKAGRFSVKPGFRVESVVQRREDFGKSDPLRSGLDMKRRRNASAALLPGLGATYSASPYVTAFAGLHKGFAPPGTTEGARPESSLNFEVGGRYHRGPRMFELVGFVSDYTNLLGADLAASGGSGSSDLFNGGAALVRGLEVSGSYNLGVLMDWRASLPVTMAYTHTRGTFSSDFESSFEPWGSVSSGDELPYLAENQLNASLALERDRWEVALSGFWTGATRTLAGTGSIPDSGRIDGHFTIDLSADVRLADGIRAFGVVRNLTDELYVAARRPAGLRPGMPRSLMAGLRASF